MRLTGFDYSRPYYYMVTLKAIAPIECMTHRGP